MRLVAAAGQFDIAALVGALDARSPDERAFDGQGERILKRVIAACSSFWLIKALCTSIGQKIVMAITGLALCGFLIVHLGGNLLLYVGAEKYNGYAHALHAQGVLLLIAELGLLFTFLLHIWLALTTTRDNNAARPIAYAMKQTKMAHGPLAWPASATMLVTGAIVLVFLLVHLSDFRWFELRHELAPARPEPSPFAKTLMVLQDQISALVYVAGSLALGYHVLHGVQSAFQTLGLNHPKYTPIVKFLSLVFAVIVALGFASFPFWAFATKTSTEVRVRQESARSAAAPIDSVVKEVHCA
jgi:succinate dehydrogenase / fumarate reductase cytochrome b subunit